MTQPHKAASVLAFDYGVKSIGLAYGQSLTGTARELPPIPAKDGIPNWGQIEELIKEWGANQLLVGLPLNMDGTDSEFAKRAKKFANRLHGRFGLSVALCDERLSTQEAKEEAYARGHKGNFAQDPIDSIAARLILESWFNQSLR